ncbi:MAG: hypothetical protein SV186_02910 [Candidatus Nanohaloarchaea archaeon]|nr:hypothetical protein [Candidatus Nanohaloarchaea archaeon]
MPASEVVDAVTDNDVLFVLVNYNNFRDVADQITCRLLEEDYACIFLTADRTFDEVREELEYRGADTSDVYVIDLTAARKGIESADEKTTLISSPTAYNDINLAFSDMYDRIKSEKLFVMLDSFTAWLLYGELKETGNFVKRLTDKAQEHGAKFVVMAMHNQLDDDAVDRFMTFCDEKFDFSDEGRP